MAYAAWIAAARCDALGGASGLTYSGRKRGSIPLTASNTDADTKATTRPVTFGAVPAVRTVVFITAIHSSTGSGVAADTRSGQAANSAAIGISAALRAVAPIPCRTTEGMSLRLHSVDLPIACATPDRAVVEIRVSVIRAFLDVAESESSLEVNRLDVPVAFRLGRLYRHGRAGILPDATSKAGQTAAKIGQSGAKGARRPFRPRKQTMRSEEHTSELQSRQYLVCRLLLEKKKQ